jgi:Protein of unknown function (DUF1573)
VCLETGKVCFGLPQNQRKPLVDEPNLWYIIRFEQLNRIGFCFAFNVELGDTKMKVRRLSLITGIISSVLVLQCLFAGQAVGAQSPASKPAAEPNGPSPKIVFEQVIHDFGPVAPGSLSNCKFKFKNEGAGILKISDVTKTCGCTVFELTKREYAPGEEGTIDVGYNASKASGPVTRHLYVLSNDKDNPRVELTINASIVQRIACDPEKLDYTIKGENAGVVVLTLHSVDDQNFAITAFNATSNAVSADFDPNKKAAKFVLKTKIDTQKTGVNSSGRVEITTSHPDCPTVTIPFSVLARFKVDPPTINILNAEAQKTIERELWLLNNYGEDFEIASATSKEGVIKVISQEKIDNRCKFGLAITPPPTPNPTRMFTDTLTITTKDGEIIEVACRGFYQRQ